ncbi:hypothetical protein C1Y63_10670 [Corynebacterium sp. 13CS0277]|uniref:hypothetical protein n=1 Tax=Corynebacterium sp. 13CS0277 TaxID=2071994 RepID=UPI000D037618|nr:hypothetical protein [Corynebacterium sp. 13CS0277]PRQ10568.1 hypothetical protein C1Y63_10670 [Corynebacterium sp. 13CS0277]
MSNNFSFDELADPFGGFTTSPYQVPREPETTRAEPAEPLRAEQADALDEARAKAAEATAVSTGAAWFAIGAGIVATGVVVALMVLGWSTHALEHFFS